MGDPAKAWADPHEHLPELANDLGHRFGFDIHELSVLSDRSLYVEVRDSALALLPDAVFRDTVSQLVAEAWSAIERDRAVSGAVFCCKPAAERIDLVFPRKPDARATD